MKKADARMSGKELKAVLPKLGFSQMSFARTFNYGGRTVRGWIAGDYPVPLIVERVINLMLKHKITLEDL